MGKKNNKGLKETVLGWFKRVHPEELWAVNEMPPGLTFRDVLKSMEDGQGMGEAGHHCDTMTREMMLDRLAELVGETLDHLVERTNAKFRERVRDEYKAKFSRGRTRPSRAKVLGLFLAAETAVNALSDALEKADCLALADKLGKDAIRAHEADLRSMKSRIEGAQGVLWKAKDLL